MFAPRLSRDSEPLYRHCIRAIDLTLARLGPNSLPLIGIGLVTVAASMALNYSLAPHAELARKTFLSQAQSRPARNIQAQVFRNRTDLRTWFIQTFRVGDNTFNNVQVLQQDAQDNIVMSYVAGRASYDVETKTWELQNVRLAYYDAAGNITKEEFQPSLTLAHWSETPFRLSSANVQAEALSLPELREYLHFNSDFPPTLEQGRAAVESGARGAGLVTRE